MRVSIWFLAVVAAVALLAVGCGDDDGDDVLASSEAGSADTSDGDTSDGDGSDGDTSDGDTSDGDTAMTGDSGSDWCRRIREIQESDEPSPLSFSFIGMDPAALEAQFTTNLEVMEEWVDTAPPEVDDQVATVLGAYTTFVAMASEAEWDVIALGSDPEFIATFDDPAIEQAANDIDAYSRDVCGVDFADFVASTPTTLLPSDDDASGAVEGLLAQFGLPANFLDEAQLACMEAELSKAFPEGMPEDLTMTADNLELFNTAGAACGIGTP